MTKTEDAGWIERLALILDAFREINPDITANQILVLLQIGGSPESPSASSPIAPV
ncbi:hypothetical protein [Rhodopseudomonas parapalustris]